MRNSWLVVAASLVVACGDDGTGGAGASGGGGDGQGGQPLGGGGASAGGNGSGGAADGGGGAAGGEGGGGGGLPQLSDLRGQIVVLQGVTNAVPSYTASASFFDWSPFDCQQQQEGACVYLTCFAPTGTGAQLSALAGDVTITGGVADLTLLPGVNNVYSQSDQLQNYFDAGDSITLAATGDEVPALTSTLTAPDGITLTSNFGSLGMIDRQADLITTWEAGPTEGDVLIGIGAYVSEAGGTRTHSLSCGFEISTGSATVPSAALQLMPAATGNISITSISSELQTVGDWSLSTRLEEFATYGGGQSAGKPIALF